MTILVERVEPDPTTRHSTVAIGHGTDEATGRSVVFAGDVRLMDDLAVAIAEHGPVLAEVEPWQFLGTEP